MHFYSFNIGDYRRQTGHLSLLEHGIYRSLLDTFYLTEEALCEDLAKLMRSHCVRTEEERLALSNVLNDFFTLTDNGYEQKTCNEVISKYREKSEKARKSANSRWENANAKSVEKSGENANALKTHANALKRDANGMLTNNHKPITNNQEPITKSKAKTSSCEKPHWIDKFYDSFWSIYPKKVNKKPAMAILKKLISKEKDHDLAVVLINAVKAKLKVTPNKQHWAAPNRWLRDEKWNDEVIAYAEAPRKLTPLEQLDEVYAKQQAQEGFIYEHEQREDNNRLLGLHDQNVQPGMDNTARCEDASEESLERGFGEIP